MDRKALIDVAQAHGLAEVAQMLASRSWTPSELELLNFAIGAQILLNETRQRALEAVVMAEYDPVRERLLRSRPSTPVWTGAAQRIGRGCSRTFSTWRPRAVRGVGPWWTLTRCFALLCDGGLSSPVSCGGGRRGG